MAYAVLSINPGSTSTKIAKFLGETELWSQTIRHRDEDLAPFGSMAEQLGFRLEKIEAVLSAHPDKHGVDAVAGRGGMLDPLPGGTYSVDEHLIARVKLGKPWDHASNLGGVLADALASEWNVPAFIVDPVCVDEMKPEAKITGLPELPKVSMSHALNTKAMVRRAAKELGVAWDALCAIVVHLGGGVSITAHRRGRIEDTSVGSDFGPFSPERAGGLPVGDVVRMCFDGRWSEQEIKRKVMGSGGIKAHLGTSDMIEVKEMVKKGDEKAAMLYRAMAWHLAKEIGAQAVSMGEKVDVILFTGGIAHDGDFVRLIAERVQWIAPTLVYPGEDEMLALTQGALRVLSGEEAPKKYGDYVNR